ncbi:glycoside hydrolase superfamily [Thelephora terrestris]|uniref:chitinase n=1 Tax=Thelephora terrestris TaxID=56493 RepID=A0A9P6HFW9_9AGAM|nr:glycoside hydrolase superfamily [Thelephora terrestris]
MRPGDLFFVLSLLVLGAHSFDITRYDNVGTYWGQNSQGANHPNDTADYQQTLSFYCQDNSTDVIPIAFLTKYFSTGGLPEINLGSTCNLNNGTFPGTSLYDCHNLASDIRHCQRKGKLVTLSLGGQLANDSLSDSDAGDFAETIWDLFLGGWSDTRPFGNAVLDGVDLDIESGASPGYATFVDRIRALSADADKSYYITASPQCPYPDASLGGTLNSSWFDAVFVQFYDNPCGLQNFNQSSYWNFGIWDYWARYISPNKDIKVYIAALGGPVVNGTGYVPPAELGTIAVQMRQNYPSFGGVMLWDASLAYANGKTAQYIKETLSLAGGQGFTFPPCSAYGYVDGQVYNAGDQVSYAEYIWEAQWWTDTPPTHDPLGPWSEISACQGTPPVAPTVVPGTPVAGSLGNSGIGGFERASFLNMGSMLQVFFGFLALCAPVTAVGLFV